MFFIGLDLGQKRDNTALVLVEKPDSRMPFLRPEDRVLQVRMAERLPLGTPYPEVVEIMRYLENLPALQSGGAIRLTVDATGVGRPVVDMLRRAGLRSWITAVTITSGDRESRRSGEGESVCVPKRDLIAGVQLALEKGELKIAKKMPEAGTLVRELLDVRMTGTAEGGLRIGADGYGQHDDLVVALALEVWRARKGW